MSIYHRYAVYYRVQRYLADVDKLCDLAMQCNIVADETMDTPEQLSKYKPVYEDPIVKAEPRLLDITEQIEDVDISDNEDGRGHGEDNTHGLECDSDDHYNGQYDDRDLTGTSRTDIQDTQIDGHDEKDGDDLDSVAEADTPESGSGQAVVDLNETTVDVALVAEYSPRGNIKESQLHRIIACGRLLYRLNSALLKNIRRVEAQDNALSSQTIQHFWNEARRLNGTERIKTVRMLKRELAASSWWDGESSWQDGENSGSSQEEGCQKCRPAPVPPCRVPGSPLQKTIDPDDLQWKDQVDQWHMDLGRARDDGGRRFNKL